VKNRFLDSLNAAEDSFFDENSIVHEGVCPVFNLIDIIVPYFWKSSRISSSVTSG
jgi:hypothetical protein